MYKVTVKKTGEVVTYETMNEAEFWVKAMVRFNNMRYNHGIIKSRDSKRNYIIEEI